MAYLLTPTTAELAAQLVSMHTDRDYLLQEISAAGDSGAAVPTTGQIIPRNT